MLRFLMGSEIMKRTAPIPGAGLVFPVRDGGVVGCYTVGYG